MTSTKQIQANRANAKKSTGPTSQTGKARSRFNSRKHGLTATLLVIGDEDPKDFDALRAALMDEYDPQGPAECELVEYLASLFWRLRRLPLFEAAIFAARHAQVEAEFQEDLTRLARFEVENGIRTADQEEEMSDTQWLVRIGRTLIKDGVWNDVLGKLARYETTLLNAVRKTLMQLHEIAERRQSSMPTPALPALRSVA